MHVVYIYMCIYIQCIYVCMCDRRFDVLCEGLVGKHGGFQPAFVSVLSSGASSGILVHSFEASFVWTALQM